MMPAWSFPAVLETLILVLFICERYGAWGRKTDRLFCGLAGLLWLGRLLMALVPHRVIFSEDEVVRLVPLYDQMLSLYVWGSHLMYALIGPNED